jgi:thiamine transporter
MSEMGDVKEDRTQRMVACAMAISLSVVLHLIRIFELPQGGSITLGSAVPIWIVARRFGLASGLVTGAGTGLLLLMLQGKAVHPAQAILDYPIAYAALGLAALTPRAEMGAGLSCIARYACHVTSGVVFFASAAPASLDPKLYSLLYNLFMLPDMAVALAIFQLLRIQAPQLLGDPPQRKDAPRGAPVGMIVFLIAGLIVFGWAVVRIRQQLPPDKTTAPLSSPKQ